MKRTSESRPQPMVAAALAVLTGAPVIANAAPQNAVWNTANTPEVQQVAATYGTRTGVITNNLPGRQFVLRANGGRVFTVHPATNAYRDLPIGTRVRVSGRINGDRINKATVTVLGNGNVGNNVTRVGVVTRNLAGNTFEFRSNAGQLYVVHLRYDEPGGIVRGARVQVKGEERGTHIRNAAVLVLGNGGGNGLQLDFRGVVVSVRYQGDTRVIRVRRDGNNQIYQVRENDDSTWRIGDRVRVRGILRAGVVLASDVDPA